MCEDEILELVSIAESCLGKLNKSLTPHSSKYKLENQDNIVIYAAKIFIHKKILIWHGDLNLTQEYKKVKKLSRKLDTPLYISYHYFSETLNFSKCIIIYNNFIEFPPESVNFYFSNEKVPKQLTPSQYEKRYPPKHIKEVYKEHDFVALKLPNPLKFKIVRDTSPLHKLQQYLIKKFDKKTAQEIYSNLYITPEYEEKLKIQIKKALKKTYPYMRKEQIIDSTSFELFNAPCCFRQRPDWADKDLGYVYIKK